MQKLTDAELERERARQTYHREYTRFRLRLLEAAEATGLVPDSKEFKELVISTALVHDSWYKWRQTVERAPSRKRHALEKA